VCSGVMCVGESCVFLFGEGGVVSERMKFNY